MKLVIIESPYMGRGPTRFARLIDRWRNIAYARRCMADSLRRGEAPLASHLLYTQPGILRDHEPCERRRGIEAGLEWGKKADLIAVYLDRGHTDGMTTGWSFYKARGIQVEFRRIGK
jgi:hypothetical protein